MLEQLINITGFTPDPFKIVDIEATLKSRGDSPNLMRLQEMHVIVGTWQHSYVSPANFGMADTPRTAFQSQCTETG